VVEIPGFGKADEEVSYSFAVEDGNLVVSRSATQTESGDTDTDVLVLTPDVQASALLNNVAVFDEESDEKLLTKHKHVISEKVSKFQLLLDEYVTKAEKEKAEKDAAKAAMKDAGRKLQAF
jgi:hypothetical protein